MFKKQNIYNAKQEIKRQRLKALTFIQTLMKNLDRDDWYFCFTTDKRDQVTQLFFFRILSMKILKLNFEMLVMNCIYKINKFKISLLIITKQTDINTSFYDICVYFTWRRNFLQISFYAISEFIWDDEKIKNVKKTDISKFVQRFYAIKTSKIDVFMTK